MFLNQLIHENVSVFGPEPFTLLWAVRLIRCEKMNSFDLEPHVLVESQYETSRNEVAQ